MGIVQNKQARSTTTGYVVIHGVANATYIVVGNNSVSNVATGDEVVTSASIAQVWWGVSNGGYCTVSRGANTVLVLTESGSMNFVDDHIPFGIDSTANVGFTINGGVGFVMVEMQKQSNTASTY